MWIYAFRRKKKTLKKCCIYNLTNTYLPITLHSTGFGGDNMSLFDFLDACLFGHPVYFDYQDFFTLD